MDTAGWTLDELTAQVAESLAGQAYPGAPNGRVRDVPDARAVRWYATIGLVDRPSGMRGRTALYGRRHLLQLVAVKRRQAEGRRLADIQAELTGASDEVLQTIAGLPAAGGHGQRATRFWAVEPAAPPPRPARPPAVPLHGLQLADGVVLLLSAATSPVDVAALTEAAQPLLATLAARGLLSTEETRP